MSARRPEPGATLGRYKILSRITSGGMADVWLATATGASGFRKTIVLKTILPKLESDPELVRLLINEALVASRLNHPNIVQIFDLGEADGHHFIAMEHVAGRTLRQIIKAHRAKKEPIPMWFALETIASVCGALQYAHDFRDDSGEPQNLVHSDMSPENVMVSFAGTVKVLDFGLVRAAHTKGLKQGGVVQGKHGYMAPECYEGGADRRADIFALGVMLYELLTGKRPFAGPSVLDVIWQVSNAKPVRPSTLIPGFPGMLEEILFAALSRDPKKRIGQAAELRQQLDGFLEANLGRRPSHALGDLVRSLFPEDPDALSAGGSSPRTGLEAALPGVKPQINHRNGADNDKDVDDEEPTRPSSAPSSASSGRKNPFTARREAATSRPASWPAARRAEPKIEGPTRDEATASRPVAAAARAASSTEGESRSATTARAAGHFERGMELVRRGALEEARVEWQAALALDPRNRDYEFNLRHLKKRLAPKEG